MTDDKPIRIEGYALTYDGDGYVTRYEMEQAVARRSSVPLSVGGLGGRVIGTAHLSVDDTGLKVTADLQPQGYRQVGVDEGIPYGDQVHDTRVPEAFRLKEAELSLSLHDEHIEAIWVNPTINQRGVRRLHGSTGFL